MAIVLPEPTPTEMATDDSGTVERSWKAIRAHRVQTIYLGHGPSRRC